VFPEEPELPSLDLLEASLTYRSSSEALCWDVVISWGSAKKTVHRDCSPSHGDEPSMVAFQSALNQGETGVVRYRSAWGGFHVALPLLFTTLFFAWLGSGRTRVRYDPESGEVVVRSRAFWRTKAETQRFRRSDIAEVFLLASTLDNGAKILRPAFRAADGHATPLGSVGLAPERAHHFVTRLKALLAESDLDGG
jgi:hypothetical protein